MRACPSLCRSDERACERVLQLTRAHLAAPTIARWQMLGRVLEAQDAFVTSWQFPFWCAACEFHKLICGSTYIHSYFQSLVCICQLMHR